MPVAREQTCSKNYSLPCRWPRVDRSLRVGSRERLAQLGCPGSSTNATSVNEMIDLLRQHQSRRHPNTLTVREGAATDVELASWLNVSSGTSPRTICEIGVNAGDSAVHWLCAHPGATYVGFDLGRFNVTSDADEFLSLAFPGRFRLIRGDALLTLPRHAREHPRSCDVMVVDGGHSMQHAFSDLSYLRVLARHPHKHVLIMDDVRCGQWWCVPPTTVWAYFVRHGVVRETGCLVDGCCSGWCWGSFDVSAEQPPPHLVCGAAGLEKTTRSKWLRSWLPRCRRAARAKFPNASRIRRAESGLYVHSVPVPVAQYH